MVHSAIDLNDLARKCMIEHQFLPNFPPQVINEIQHISSPAPDLTFIKDLRHLLWFSLDNDDSRDLDQLTYAEVTNDSNKFKIFIAIADVDSLVKQGLPTDQYAQMNTTSVYTPSIIFTMLPSKLSYDLTSLNENQDRLSIVVEIEINNDGSPHQSKLYRAYVKNHAKLAYDSVSAWLDGNALAPQAIQQNHQLENQVRLQDKIANILRSYRHEKGSLTLETIEPYLTVKSNEVIAIHAVAKNRGRNLIEDFMIAANQATARFLYSHDIPSLRRVVRIPKRWDRIVTIAKEYGETLPPMPDAKALDLFLIRRRSLDPLHFPDLSLIMIKLLGNGEYIVEYPGEASIGHFSLAVKNYTHSTAPNRRFPDLITQRQVKSILQNQPLPYRTHELEKLAKHCTQKEDDAEKVERKMKKSAACLMFSKKINEVFDAIVTGASEKGTWVRILQFPIEGKLIKGYENIDVGDQIRVRLIHVDIEQGFIDFIRE